jgi:alpha-tubulin suppressor-like RCC1 family protein
MKISKTLFKRLSHHFKNNIKFLTVEYRNIIIVTKDNKVYQFEENVGRTYSSLAYTSDELVVKQIINKSIVDELCDKDVVDIKSGSLHSIARTSEGKLYIWGVCDYGVLGLGMNDKYVYRPVINLYLNDLEIIDMSCGTLHTLVLTSSGDIYSWGLNSHGQTGNGSDSQYQLIPMKINSEKFKAVSCGSWYSMALTEDGRVFCCGKNDYGRLGDGCATNSNKLKYIDINNVIIGKIGCGLSHSLLLSNEGEIYVLGEPFKKELEEKGLKRQKFNHSNKFCDIATHRGCDFFAALSENGIYLVWGQFNEKDDIIYEPKETDYKSFNEIFIKYSQFTCQHMEEMIIQFEDSFIRSGEYEYWYKNEEKLGEGSYGQVFRVNASNGFENYINAIKKIKFKNENEKEILKELDIYCLISKIKHKNILTFNEFWIENDSEQKFSTLYIEMELCEQTLGEFITSIEKIEFGETNLLKNMKFYISSSIFIDLLEGVNYLHEQNPPIIHRDLCPDNVLVKLEKNDKVFVKIADFGLVTIHKFAEALHQQDVGHVRYIAPEVGNGMDYNTKADIYSLGKIVNDLFDIDLDDRYELICHYFES